MDLSWLFYYLWRNYGIWYFLYHILTYLFYYCVMVSNICYAMQCFLLLRTFLQLVERYNKFAVLEQSTCTILYYFLLNRIEQLIYLLIFYLYFTLLVGCEHFIQIFTSLYFFLLFYYLLDGIEMIIFEHISLKLLNLLIAKRASMVPIYNFFDACFTKYMPASSYVCIFNLIQTNCALKLCL
jgi:hypothetical protein